MKKEEISYQKFLDIIKEQEKEIKTEKKEEKKELKVEKPKIQKKGKKKKKAKKLKKKKIPEKETKKEEKIELEEIKEEILPEAIVELEEKEEEYLVFKVKDEYFSIPTNLAKEVVNSVEYIEAHGLPEFTIGMANFRNKMVPVISLGKLLNIEEETEPFSYIYFEKGKESFFIRTGEVKGIFRKREIKTLETPYNLDKEVFKKILLVDNILVPLLDIGKLFEKKE